MSEIEPHPNPESRWQHRRRIAYRSLWAGLAFPFVVAGVAYIAPEVAEVVKAVAWPFYLFVGSNVGLYIGAATWETTKIGVNR